MLTQERHETILRRLQADGRVLSADLSRTLGVSEDTVRRDLRALAGAGLLMKVHGGAVPRSTTKLEFNERSQERQREKRLIAKVDLEEPINGTVTAANGVLYVATMKHLYAVRSKS